MVQAKCGSNGFSTIPIATAYGRFADFIYAASWPNGKVCFLVSQRHSWLFINLDFFTLFSDHFAECFEKVGQIGRMYGAAVKASPATHADLQELLQLLCRSLACLCHGAANGLNQSVDVLHSVIRMIFDVCADEVEVLGHQVGPISLRFFTLSQFLHVFLKFVSSFPSKCELIRRSLLEKFIGR